MYLVSMLFRCLPITTYLSVLKQFFSYLHGNYNCQCLTVFLSIVYYRAHHIWAWRKIFNIKFLKMAGKHYFLRFAFTNALFHKKINFTYFLNRSTLRPTIVGLGESCHNKGSDKAGKSQFSYCFANRVNTSHNYKFFNSFMTIV